jgi:hypothetical protein
MEDSSPQFSVNVNANFPQVMNGTFPFLLFAPSNPNPSSFGSYSWIVARFLEFAVPKSLISQPSPELVLGLI